MALMISTVLSLSTIFLGVDGGSGNCRCSLWANGLDLNEYFKVHVLSAFAI